MNRLLSYKEKNTWIHRLSGVTKLLFIRQETVHFSAPSARS